MKLLQVVLFYDMRKSLSKKGHIWHKNRQQ